MDYELQTLKQLRKILDLKENTIRKQYAIIDEMFVLLCERMTREEIVSLKALLDMISEVTDE